MDQKAESPRSRCEVGATPSPSMVAGWNQWADPLGRSQSCSELRLEMNRGLAMVLQGRGPGRMLFIEILIELLHSLNHGCA